MSTPKNEVDALWEKLRQNCTLIDGSPLQEMMNLARKLQRERDEGEAICRTFNLAVAMTAIKGLADSIIVSEDYKDTLLKTLALVQQLADEANRLRDEANADDKEKGQQ